MRYVVLDTDIGIDSDDAAALNMLLEIEKCEDCEIKCITVSTVREGATSTVRAFLDSYGRGDVPVGRRFGDPLPCDSINTYAKRMMQSYSQPESDIPAVQLLRKTIAEAVTQVTIITIGPLSNLSDLLKSEPDEYSSLNGIELVRKNVDEIFIMGGNFVENSENYDGEFNIKQDIEAARFVFENSPKNILLVPFECGEEVYTDIPTKDCPLKTAMTYHAESLGVDPDGFRRSSWDPLTCFCALYEYFEFFYISKKVKVTVDDCGRTFAIKDPEGNVFYISPFAGYEEIGLYINYLLK